MTVSTLKMRPAMPPRHSSTSMITRLQPTFSSPREHWQLAVNARCSALHTLTVPDSQVDGVVNQLFDDELQAMREALSQMEALRNRAVVRITMLPLPVLARVFYFASELYAPPGGYPEYCRKQQPVFMPTPDVIVCSHVCRKWRAVSLEHPELWTSLSFPALTAPIARLFAIRSRDLPLDVNIDASLVCSQWPGAFAQSLHDAGALKRIQSLALAADIASQRGMNELREIISTFGKKARSLRTLSIHGAHRGTAPVLKLALDLFADAPGISSLSLGHTLPAPDAPMVRSLTKLNVRAPHGALVGGENAWLSTLLRNARRLQILTIFIDDAFKCDLAQYSNRALFVPDSLSKVTLYGAAPACVALALRFPPDVRLALHTRGAAGPQLTHLLDTQFRETAPMRAMLLSLEGGGRGLAALGAWHASFARHAMPATNGSETPPGSLLPPRSVRAVSPSSSLAVPYSASTASSYSSSSSGFAATSVSSRTSASSSPTRSSKRAPDMGILNFVPPAPPSLKPALWLDARQSGGGIVSGDGASVMKTLGVDVRALETLRVDERAFTRDARRTERAAPAPAWAPAAWHATFGRATAVQQVFVHGSASASLLAALAPPAPAPGSRRNSRDVPALTNALFPALELLELHELAPADADVSGALARRAQLLGHRLATLRLPRTFECVRGLGRGAAEVEFFD